MRRFLRGLPKNVIEFWPTNARGKRGSCAEVRGALLGNGNWRMGESTLSKSVVNARWVLNWPMADGKKHVKARTVAKGYQDPDPRDGFVETSGRASGRSSHLQAISLCAPVGRMRVERNAITPRRAVLGRDFVDPSRRGDTLGICSGEPGDVWAQSRRSVYLRVLLRY